MRSAWKMGLMAGAVALMLGAGLTFAASAGQAAAAKPAKADGLAGLGALIPAGATATSANTDKGVNLILTADQPDQVPRVQKEATARVTKLSGAAGRAAKRRPEGLAGLIASGAVKLNAENFDKGVVVAFTSDNADAVSQLQTDIPQMIEAHAAMATPAEKVLAALEDTAPANQLLASGKVKINVKETAKGVVVEVYTDDPKLALQLRDRMLTYFEGMPDRAKLIEQWLSASGNVAGAPKGPAPAAGGRRAARTQAAPQSGQPAQPTTAQ